MARSACAKPVASRVYRHSLDVQRRHENAKALHKTCLDRYVQRLDRQFRRNDRRGILALMHERAIVPVALCLAEGRLRTQQHRRGAVLVVGPRQGELTVMRMSKSLCSKWAESIVCRQRSMVLIAACGSMSENMSRKHCPEKRATRT